MTCVPEEARSNVSPGTNNPDPLLLHLPYWTQTNSRTIVPLRYECFVPVDFQSSLTNHHTTNATYSEKSPAASIN